VTIAVKPVLELEHLPFAEEIWWNGFLAIARAARGRGVASSIKRAQIP
jgi:hypothetical protein